MTSLEHTLKQLGRGELADLPSSQLVAQRWLSLWGGFGIEHGLQGVGALKFLDWCAGSETPSNTQLGRMAGMIAVMEEITATTPLTVREGEAFVKTPLDLLDGATPLEVINDFNPGGAEAPAIGVQLAQATEKYINESMVWLTAIEAVQSLQRV